MSSPGEGNEEDRAAPITLRMEVIQQKIAEAAEEAKEALRKEEEAKRELEEVNRELEEANRELEEANRELEEAKRQVEEEENMRKRQLEEREKGRLILKAQRKWDAANLEDDIAAIRLKAAKVHRQDLMRDINEYTPAWDRTKRVTRGQQAPQQQANTPAEVSMPYIEDEYTEIILHGQPPVRRRSGNAVAGSSRRALDDVRSLEEYTKPPRRRVRSEGTEEPSTSSKMSGNPTLWKGYERERRDNAIRFQKTFKGVSDALSGFSDELYGMGLMLKQKSGKVKGKGKEKANGWGCLTEEEELSE